MPLAMIQERISFRSNWRLPTLYRSVTGKPSNERALPGGCVKLKVFDFTFFCFQDAVRFCAHVDDSNFCKENVENYWNKK